MLYNKVCNITDCDSEQEGLNAINESQWLCDQHLRELDDTFSQEALEAMTELGLPQDEAELMLEDYQLMY